MYTNELDILRDALNFLYQYTNNETLRGEIKKTGYYNHKPLFFYIQILVGYSGIYRQYYTDVTKTSALDSIKQRIKQIYKQSFSARLQLADKKEPDKIDLFLEKCYKNQTVYNQLRTTMHSMETFTPQQITTINAYSELPNGQQKQDLFQTLLASQNKSEKEDLNQSINKLVNRNSPVTDKKKELAVNILIYKMQKYGKYMTDPTGRAWLIQRGFVSKEEINAILEAGLIKASDIPPKYNQNGFKDDNERKKATKEAAERLMANLIKEDEARYQALITNPVSLLNIPNWAKNFSSQAQIFGKKLLTKIGPNIFSAGIGGTVGMAVGGTAGIPFGAAAGALFPNAVKSGAIRTAFSGGLKAALGLGSKALGAAAGPVGWVALAATTIIKPTKIIKWVAIGVGAFFCLPILLILIQTNSLILPPGIAEVAESAPILPPGGTIGSGGCPDTSGNTNGFSCHYLGPSINIFDTNISQSSIELYKNKYAQVFVSAGKGDRNEFNKRVDYIVQKSKEGRLNPALFLGYWKTESLFSTIGSRDMGCVGDDFYEQVRCALAIEDYSNPSKNPVANCARSSSADSEACLALKNIRSTFDQTHAINYPIRSFDNFTESYGPYDHLTGGLPTNCISTYNKLIEVAKELGSCQIPPTGPVLVNNDSQRWVKNNFNITFENGFNSNIYQWAYEILAATYQTAPKFRDLIANQNINIIPTTGTSQRQGSNLLLKNYTDENTFKLIFIHELAHSINIGRPGIYGKQLLNNVIPNEGYLTIYSANASPYEAICDNTHQENTLADEDFSETVAYYINKNASEMSMSSQCLKGQVKSTTNPFQAGKNPLHFTFIKNILGP